MERKAPIERKKASEFPQELLNLFDKYVHGDIDRRAVKAFTKRANSVKTMLPKRNISKLL